MSIRNQTLGALAAAAVLGVPMMASAQSGVTVYGIVDASVRRADNANAAGDAVTSLNDGVYVGSRFGLRGSEDLGGGLKAIFTLENGFDPSSGTLQQVNASASNGSGAAAGGRLFGREASVGLASDTLGTVTLGRQYTLAHPLSGRFQPQPNPNLDAISMFSTHHVARQDNMARYFKQLGPVGLYASYTFSESNGRGRGVGASYGAGPLDLVAYYQEVNNAANTVTRGISGAGGSYAVTKDLKAFLGYMKRNDRGASAQENDVASVGMNYNLAAPLVLTVNYAQDRQSGVNAGKRRMGYVGLDYLFSKRTDLYAEVDHNRLTGAYPLPAFMGTRASATSFSVGLRHRF